MGAGDSVLERISNEWNKFRYLLRLLTNKGFPLKTKGRFLRVCEALCYTGVRLGQLKKTILSD